MESISVTFDVSNPDKSSEVKEMQFSNIARISVTFDVSKPERSTDPREVQSKNMECISETADVSKLDRSMVVRAGQEANIKLISVTPVVTASERSAACTFVKCSNNPLESAGNSAPGSATIFVISSFAFPAFSRALFMLLLVSVPLNSPTRCMVVP